jgi:predicted nucleic acid-binding protein
MKLALDTNRYVDLCKGLAPTLDLVAIADAVFLPFVVVAELRAGFVLGRRGADNERVLRRFLQKDGVHLLLATEQTTFHYASVFRHLREGGTPIPTNDMWIAALVLEHNLVLHARDVHFDRLPQLPRV